MRIHLVVASILACCAPAGAQTLADPSAGVLELVTPDPAEQAKLDHTDGLAFDAFGNLFAVLEISGAGGGVVSVDKATGLVTVLVTGISRADQIALDASGDFLLTSEITPASSTARVYRLTVGYGAGNVPQAATTSASSVTTSLAVDNPEGLVVLPAAGPYGAAGDLYVAEDRNPGRILHVVPASGATSALASGLVRPEGMAFGDFGGALPPALYAAETSTHRVLRIDAAGTVSVFGNAAAVGLTFPDNLEFGPDGYLYVSEDRPAPASRIVRVAPDGTFEVFATGFGQAQGMVFDADGDLYLSEQDLDRIWRVRFLPPPGAFCDDGDGALASCPCSNPGAPDSGCDNPAGTGGVRAQATAFEPAPSHAVVTCSGYPPMGSPAAILLRSATLAPGGPVVFGDGLRCVDVPVVRLGAALASGGVSVHSFGHGAGPGAFHYQAWYRSQPAGYCTPEAFNLSSGVTLTWP
jgi:sugar lactone lactonase YvrE